MRGNDKGTTPVLLGLLLIGLITVISVPAYFLLSDKSSTETLLKDEHLTVNPYCQIARPVFGSVCCELTGRWVDVQLTYRIHSSEESQYYYAEFICNSEECKISMPQISCPTHFTDPIGQSLPHIAIKVDNICRGTTSTGSVGLFFQFSCTGPSYTSGDITVNRGQKVQIYATCYGWGYGREKPITVQGKYSMKEQKLYIWDGYHYDVPQTEGCIKQNFLTTYLKDQPTSGITNLFEKIKSYLPGANIGAVKSNVNKINSLNDIPANPVVGSCYLFLARWDKDIALNLRPYDSDGDGKADSDVFCDVNTGSVKKYEYVNTPNGCFYIPTQEISLPARKYKCCVPEDCRTLGASWTCNIHTFSCEEKYSGNPCNSVYDCGAQYTSGELCEVKNNKFLLTKWGCDTSKPQSGSKGTCYMVNQKEVKCCHGNCPGNKYCDYEKGCLEQNNQEVCGSLGVYCCREGGPYKPQSCESGKTCCFETANAFRGLCKVKCDEKLLCNNNGKCEPDIGENIDNCPIDCKSEYKTCPEECSSKHPTPWGITDKLWCQFKCWLKSKEINIFVGIAAILISVALAYFKFKAPLIGLYLGLVLFVVSLFISWVAVSIILLITLILSWVIPI